MPVILKWILLVVCILKLCANFCAIRIVNKKIEKVETRHETTLIVIILMFILWFS